MSQVTETAIGFCSITALAVSLTLTNSRTAESQVSTRAPASTLSASRTPCKQNQSRALALGQLRIFESNDRIAINTPTSNELSNELMSAK